MIFSGIWSVNSIRNSIFPAGFKKVFSFYLKKDAAFLSAYAGKIEILGNTVKMFMFSVFLFIVLMELLCYN